MPAVNPDILVWARETAGLTLQDAVAKVGIRGARGLAAIDRLTALERGDEEPTRPVLVKMARQYGVPCSPSIWAAPPRRDEHGADFRTLPGARTSEQGALMEALVRNLRSRQEMVRAALEAEDEAEPLPFVGVLLGPGELEPHTQSLRWVLRHNAEAAHLLQRALKAIARVLGDDLDAATYYAQPNAEEAFRLLRSRTEGVGVFVLLKGDLGSHHTALDPEVFRGFVIADNVAPFVVINDNDSRAARSFTLLHELTHLLLGQTGFAGVVAETEVEEFCDRVAAEWLLPPWALGKVGIERGRDIAEQKQLIGAFARKSNLSRTMVAYRLLRANRLERSTFEHLRAEFREEWRQLRDRRRTRQRESEGGPSYYAVRRHRVGQGLLTFTRRLVGSGALSTTKAARILGVKPPHVGKMLRPARSR